MMCRRIPDSGQCSLKTAHGIGVCFQLRSASCDDQRQCVRSAGLFAQRQTKEQQLSRLGRYKLVHLWIRWMRPRVDVVAFTSTIVLATRNRADLANGPRQRFTASAGPALGTIQTDRNQSSANNPSCSSARESGGAVPPKSGAIWPAPALRTPDRSHSRTPAARSLQKRLHKMSRIRARKRNCQP